MEQNSTPSPQHEDHTLSPTSTLTETKETTEASPEESSSSSYETRHVHNIYDAIAPHFSQTRHKPWPIVSQFLHSQPPGSIGLDIGTGNGKYLSVNTNVLLLGSDMSDALLRLAREKERDSGSCCSDLLRASALDLPHPSERFDFAICIAVVHHLSTPRRRVEAVGEVLACLRRGSGRVLLYVWALEQAGSRRGWDEGCEQDVMVPWVMKGEDKVFQRYYHLYRKGELEGDVLAAGGRVLSGGWEKDNWWVIAAPGS